MVVHAQRPGTVHASFKCQGRDQLLWTSLCVCAATDPSSEASGIGGGTEKSERAGFGGCPLFKQGFQYF